MKVFNNHSGSRGLPRFIKGICWATGSFLRTDIYHTMPYHTPFTEGVRGS